MIERRELDISVNSHFIGCWQSEDTTYCDDVISFFENNKDLQSAGVTNHHKVQESMKISTDISVYPKDLEEQKFASLANFMGHLKGCHVDYLKQWPFLKTVFPKMHIGPFNVRRYDAGGHFGTLHSERTSLNVLHRILAWMTYLNDVPEGGETEYPMFGLKIKPEKGKTVIWPAEWTHAHMGSMVTTGPKYIITGWLHHPDTTEE